MERTNNILNNKYSNISISNIALKGIHTSCVLNMDTIKVSDNNSVKKDLSVLDVLDKKAVNIILQDVYRSDDNQKAVVKMLDDFMFITSLSLSELLSDKSENKNVIVSTNFYHMVNSQELIINNLIQNLRNKVYNNDLYIIEVSWLETIYKTKERKEISFTNVYGEKYKLNIQYLGYDSFLKNINIISESISNLEKENKDYLGINPIIIFKGLSWSNIVHLFKLNNIIIHGGSNTRRHKLSICEYRLAVFLDLLGIYANNKSYFYKSQSDKYFSSPRFNRTNEINMENHSYISVYLTITENIDLKLKLDGVQKNICELEILIGNIKNDTNSLEMGINTNISKINYIKNKISFLNTKFVEGIREKHKASLTGRIKSFKSEIQELDKTNQINESKISRLGMDLNDKLNKLAKLKSEENKLSEVIIPYSTKVQAYKNNINNKNMCNVSNRREYHSLSGRKYYSTNNSVNKINFNINSPIFIELQRILNNSQLDSETQKNIENYLRDQGVNLLSDRFNQVLDINYSKLNPKVIDYLKKSREELDILLDNEREGIMAKNTVKNNYDFVEFELFSCLTNQTIISHLLGRVLRIISNNHLKNHNTNCTELAAELGESLKFSYYSFLYHKKINNKAQKGSEAGGLKQFIDDLDSPFKNKVTSTILIQFGLKLLYYLEEVKLITSKTQFIDKSEQKHYFVANDQILKEIGEGLVLLDVPYKIPMIVPPKEYKRVKGKDILGGFLLNDVNYTMGIIIENSELKEQSKIEDINIIYDMVNNLASVGYKINTPVLDFILEKGIEYDLLTDPEFKHPLEIKKTNQKKLTFLENNTLDSFLSKKKLEMNILGLALIFKNIPEFFIPLRIDNRGRIYCMVDYLNYQGIELAKSLLLFSKGEVINKCDTQSIDYLKIFGANCFGNGLDKKSYNERVEWVNNKEEDILNFRNGKLIKEADSKLLFIAFCFEYMNYHQSLYSNETSYISHFPIQLDATCNGYQHLSLLTGDESLATQLNLISGDKNSIPNDFYDFVALKINDYLTRQIVQETIILDKEFAGDPYIEAVNKIKSCKRLLKLNKNRTLVKLPIMVKAYNASPLTMIDYVKEKFETVIVNNQNEKEILANMNEIIIKDKLVFKEKSSQNDVYLKNKDFGLLIKIIEQIIVNEFPKLNEFSSYLKKIANICINLNLTISWPLPTGLNVNQYYVDSEAIRLKPFRFRNKTFNIKVLNNKVNKRKQIRALMPNLIHSLDAASLCLLFNNLYQEQIDVNKKLNFFAIHDCFAVTANNVVNLIKNLKLVYIKIYSDDTYLETFDHSIINLIKLQYGNESFDETHKLIKVNGQIIEYPDVNRVIMGQIKASNIQKAEYSIN